MKLFHDHPNTRNEGLTASAGVPSETTLQVPVGLVRDPDYVLKNILHSLGENRPHRNQIPNFRNFLLEWTGAICLPSRNPLDEASPDKVPDFLGRGVALSSTDVGFQSLEGVISFLDTLAHSLGNTAIRADADVVPGIIGNLTGILRAHDRISEEMSLRSAQSMGAFLLRKSDEGTITLRREHIDEAFQRRNIEHDPRVKTFEVGEL